MIRVAAIRRHVARLTSRDGETETEARARMDVVWPRLLERDNVQVVAAGTPHGPHTWVVTPDAPGDPTCPDRFVVIRMAWVTDRDVPSDVARALDPEQFSTIRYEVEE